MVIWRKDSGGGPEMQPALVLHDETAQIARHNSLVIRLNPCRQYAKRLKDTVA